MRKLLLAFLFAAGVAHADLPCPLLTPANAFILYAGSSSHCLITSQEPCTQGELIQFDLATFGYNFACFTHAFRWNFGDSTEVVLTRASTHVYTSPGMYAVTVTINSPMQQLTLTQNVFISDPQPSFEGEELFSDRGRVPRGYRFIVGSAVGKGDWLWDFGDGTTARGPETEQTHIYKTGGKFLVTLTSTQAPNSYALEVSVPVDRRRSARH
ncbi:MAG: hypothetical protein DMF56_00665 [Acidobacteria bacterium]|nr:MAG: hypothetical protein DMF56_00665 [Acidobacteriota bacterium]